MADSKQIKVGVYIPCGAQLLDAACVDVLAMMSKEYMSLIPMIPKHITALAPSLSILYITAPPPTPTPSASTSTAPPPIPLTANMTIHAHHTLTDAEVQPGNLDILVVPGPDPCSEYSPEVLARCDVLCICTGAYLCAAAGILEGRQVSGPRGLQAELGKRYPGTEWVGEKYRWVQDGNVWTSGGVTNGNDMVAAYARSGKYFPGPVAEIACKMAEVGDRPRVYEVSNAVWTMGMAWQIIKAWFVRQGKKND